MRSKRFFVQNKIVAIMSIVPLFKVSDMRSALTHYTEVLDFICPDPEDTVDSPVVDLQRGDARFQITTHESERLYGSIAYIWVEDIDALFKFYVKRGLDTNTRKDSIVHQGPIDQTWGRREFYVTDQDGNTLRFCCLSVS